MLDTEAAAGENHVTRVYLWKIVMSWDFAEPCRYFSHSNKSHRDIQYLISSLLKSFLKFWLVQRPCPWNLWKKGCNGYGEKHSESALHKCNYGCSMVTPRVPVMVSRPSFSYLFGMIWIWRFCKSEAPIHTYFHDRVFLTWHLVFVLYLQNRNSWRTKTVCEERKRLHLQLFLQPLLQLPLLCLSRLKGQALLIRGPLRIYWQLPNYLYCDHTLDDFNHQLKAGKNGT